MSRLRPALRGAAVVAAALLAASVLSGPVVAKDPNPPKHRFLGGSQTTAVATAAPVAGFTDSIVISGLTNPSAMQFANDGRVVVTQKNGLVLVYPSLGASPIVAVDLRPKVDDYWDRGLLGLALDPLFTTNGAIYVLYTYDHILGDTAAPPRWGDACPTPPGPTTDGCVVSARLSKLVLTDNVAGPEQVLIEDWCQQFPSHSIGTVRYGPDGMLYVGGGEGANFNAVDYGQYGGGAGSPTPLNPCGDPPARLGGIEASPGAEGGALRSQDVRTIPTQGGGATYAQTVLADAPSAYWRLAEASGSVANDETAFNRDGVYAGGNAAPTLGTPGLITSDPNTAARWDGDTSYSVVEVDGAASLFSGRNAWSVEAWVNHTPDGAFRYLFSAADASSVNIMKVQSSNSALYLSRDAGSGDQFAVAAPLSAGVHHVVGTYDGANLRLYVDGVLASGAIPSAAAVPSGTKAAIGNHAPTWGVPFNGTLDEVAVYNTALSAAQVSAHFAAGNSTGGTNMDPTGLDGTIVRVNPATGAAASGNPLGSSPDLNARKIVVNGMRNPFRFTFRPGTNELWVGDVGWSTWEEIDRIQSPTAAVTNLGWPCYEGVGQQSGYAGLTMCQNLYADTINPARAPYYTYNHSAAVVTGDACPTANGSAITGLAFYTGGSYPSTYTNALFFADHSRNCVWAMLPGAGGLPDPNNRQLFIGAAGNPVDLEIGPGGDLFYSDLEGGAIHRVTYNSGSNTPPVASFTATPSSGMAPLSVSFDGRGSSDADGDPLTYAWDFTNDGTTDATASTTSFTYTAASAYTAKLTVTDSKGASSSTTKTISANNSAPTVTVSTNPAPSALYVVGDPYMFSGGATDPQDGTEPASRFSWVLTIHHCTTPTTCHTHDIQTWTGVTSGNFNAPDHDYPSFLTLTATVTDAGGLQGTGSVELDPKTVDLTFQTSPNLLSLSVDGTSLAGTSGTPTITKRVIVNSQNTVSAPTPQVLGGIEYTYSSWSDGSTSASRTFVAPATWSTPLVAQFAASSADVSVSKTGTYSKAGSSISWTIPVRNAGGGITASGIVVSDVLSTNLGAPTSLPAGCTYNASTRMLSCTIASLAAGATQTILVTTPVVARKGNRVDNTVTVTSSTRDATTTNNSATTSVPLK